MKTYINTLICFLALTLIVTSCNKDDNEDPKPIEEEKDFKTYPYSFTATLAPISGNNEGIELKQTFANGDVIEVTNAQVLYEPLVLSCTEFNGQTSATFSGEMKVKKDADLASNLHLSAVLKNTNTKTLYNSGKPITDVMEIINSTDDFNQFCYWSCENIVDNKIELVQSTVFLEINIPFGAKINMENGLAVFSDAIKGKHYFAIPNGTKIEVSSINVEQVVKVSDKVFYQIAADVPENCIPGLFSIGDNSYAYFSKGNLQYRPLDGAWRIAPLQYQRGINLNQLTSLGENYSQWQGEDKWTEFFTWGTWVVGGKPSSTSTNIDDFTNTVDDEGNLVGDCAIGKEWVVPTYNEWDYILFKRANADQKRGFSSINGVRGLVLLPDDFNMPDGITFVAEQDALIEFTLEQWTKMESEGAVFLPAFGLRFGSNFNPTPMGACWSSTMGDTPGIGRNFNYSNDFLQWDQRDKLISFMVRLIKKVD